MYELSALSDAGRQRDHNEDAFLLGGQVSREVAARSAAAPCLVAVADGVGGAEKGEVASFRALERLAGFTPSDDLNALAATLNAIDAELCAFAKTAPDHAGMGTTIAGIICLPERVHCFHAGDSRVYRFRDGFLRQLTTDHSLVQALYAAGEIEREAMATHPNKHVITKLLGGNCERPLDAEIDHDGLPVRTGDLFLLCSDGLSDMLSTDAIEAILSREEPLPTKAQALVDAANAAGGEDNITVVLCLSC